uniref:protein-secreting ATPase n=2 Tax=Desulfobacterium TaxID=2295 RepID=E1YJQ1_9BACT|nr:General secretion pathway protein E [uncultured Desulfobacterium sp.]
MVSKRSGSEFCCWIMEIRMETLEHIKDNEVNLNLLSQVPYFYSKNNLVIPLRIEEKTLIAAVSGNNGLLAAVELAKRLGVKVKPLRAEPGIVIEAISKYYGQISNAEEVMDNMAAEDLSSVATEFEKPRDILELTEDAPIIRLLNALFQQAFKERASDIHIEPYEKDLEVRMRIDGILHRVLRPPKIIQEALISRIKIMANLDIAEKRLPQDGRIRLLIGGQDIDLRVSIIPTSFGERAVLRLLNRKQGLIGLYEVGLDKQDENNFEKLLENTSGIILVTGPTGSGKTTTLYAALNRVHTEGRNIITVEDPVEYQLKGIGQMQVNPKIGLSFASGLRSILRQDPDIIMVGEIRDFETAEIAIQASLTGHLVLSTLHTNDAVSSIVRLADMGMEPFLVASSLVAVVAQRLVRNICPYCKETFMPAPSEEAYFPMPVEQLYRGKGCKECRESGYLGRTGIFEILSIDNNLRQMISQRVDAQAIREYAVSKGMRTLYAEGIDKVLKGITTLQEILRVTQKDYAEI